MLKMTPTSSAVDQHPEQQQQQDKWSIYSAAQNLPAVLNDPNRGKQTNFFIKTWGDSFVEKNQIERSPFLPEITYAHFDNYFRKINKRYKRHLKLTAHDNNKLETNHLKTRNNHKNDLIHNEININKRIPEIFLKPNFPLNDPIVFNKVFKNNDRKDDHLLQEELSHYLDIVEVQIAQQVSQKSGAFFHAMTSHDTIMEQMGVAYNEIRLLREKIQKIDKTLAKDSLRLIGLARSKMNHLRLVNKLKLMSTVLQTQPTIQLLLSSSDYVGALELITSTQEVLAKELAGVTSLRHLPSQLKEMSKLIDKMLTNEFERYAAADLHRPFDNSNSNNNNNNNISGVVLEQERLISLVAGLLRQNHLNFLEIYKQEAITAVQTLLKQLMIEQLADVEDETTEHCLTGSGEIAPIMEADNWLKVVVAASESCGKLIQRVKCVHDVIKEVSATTAGLTIQLSSNSSTSTASATTAIDHQESFLSLEDHNRVEIKLKDLLISICDYCNERLASIVSTQTDKQTITPNQIIELSKIVDNFTDYCERICGKQCAALRASFKIQAGNYVHKFHTQRKNKLTLLLDAERWKVADVPIEIQQLVDQLALGNVIKSLPNTQSNDELNNIQEPSPSLRIGTQNYTTVGTVLILIRLVCEYCVCAYNLQLLSPIIGRNLIELLRTFNSRCCQLVLGAGALRTAGLKTITSTNLALTSRSLQMVLWMLPNIRRHFSYITNDPLNGLDSIEKDIGHHIQQLETKILSIMNSLLCDQLNDWDAKPPVPSKAFRNVSRHLTKLHEAVSSVLPEEQVSDIYEVIHKNFKSRLRDQLIKMNIQNNGGPQHGLVTTEIVFYLETLKQLKVLPDKYLSDKAMDDIWIR